MRGLIDIGGLGSLGQVPEGTAIEGPGYQVSRDPVGHNAGQNLVDIQKRLQKAGDAAPQGAGKDAAQERQDPNDPGRNHISGNGQRDHQGSQSAHQELTGRTDVEQACLEGNCHRKAGHNNGNCAEQHIAQVLRIKAPHQIALGILALGKDTGKDHLDTFGNILGQNVFFIRTHDHDYDGTHDQAHDNGDQRSKQLSGSFFFIDIQQGILPFHYCSPPIFIRLAPAM